MAISARWILGLLFVSGASSIACSSNSDPDPAGAMSGSGGTTTSNAGAQNTSGAGTSTGGSAAGGGGNAGGAGAGSGGVANSAGAGGAIAGGSGGAAGSTGGAASGGAAGASTVPEVSSDGDGDSVIGPDYTKDPNLTDLGNPQGQKFSFSLNSADSAIFNGTDATLTKPFRDNKTTFDRGITVYVPAQYQDGQEAAVLVIQDGPGPIDSVSRALDNLTISTDPMKKLPPFVVVAVQNGSDRDGSDGQGSERGLEYDTMSDRYSTFIDTEVLPAVVADPQVHAAYPGLTFTRDPQGRGSFGCSSGGAAALSMGWFAPDLWRRIITYSGTFVDQQNHSQPEAQLFPFGAWEYHSEMELIKNTENKPLRIFINANENDLGSDRDETTHHNWLMANQRTAAALMAKQYHYQFAYAQGVGHCDGNVQDQTIAEVLSWVWRGYAAP